MTNDKNSTSRRWWQTDCEACKRARLIIFWLVVISPWAIWWVRSLGSAA